MIREKKIYCGKKFMEVDIYPYTKTQIESRRRKRGKKKKVTAPKQKNLNDKNARRYLTQLTNTNFGPEDIHITLTYNNRELPESLDEAEKEARNYIRRVNYLRKKMKLDPVKYILVIEHTTFKKSDKPKRVHHHIIMNGGLSRDDLEDLWRRPRKKGQKKGDKIGIANTYRLQLDENGLAGLANYLCKEPNKKKRWSSSQNLEKPIEAPPNDHKYSRRQLVNIAKGLVDDDYIRKKYPGWRLTDKLYGIQVSYSEQMGYYIYLKLKRDTS